MTSSAGLNLKVPFPCTPRHKTDKKNSRATRPANKRVSPKLAGSMYTGGTAGPNQVAVETAPSSSQSVSREIITNMGRRGRALQRGGQPAGKDYPWQRCGEKNRRFSMNSGVQHFTPKSTTSQLTLRSIHFMQDLKNNFLQQTLHAV